MKIFSGWVVCFFFRRREWSCKGEAAGWNTDRLWGAKSELQINLLTLSLVFALGRQHLSSKAGNSGTYGYPRAGLLPALTHNMLTANWNLRLQDNSLFCFFKMSIDIKSKNISHTKPNEYNASDSFLQVRKIPVSNVVLSMGPVTSPAPFYLE